MNVSDRMGTSQTQDLVLLGALAVGFYVIYQIVQGVKQTAHVVQTVTAPVADGIAKAWIAMEGLGGGGSAMQPLGNVLFPDGTYTPIARLKVKSDTLGNVYVYQQGRLFQLQPSDINGDWPASEITDPSQIGKAPP